MSVSTLVLLGLAVVWAIVLLPEAVKKFSGVRHGDPIRSFNRHLDTLERANPLGRGPAQGRSNVIDLRSHQARRPEPALGAHTPAVRPVSPEVRKRRQEVLTVLGGAAVLTLLCTVAFGGPFLLLHLLADALLVTYVVLLYQVTSQQAPASGLAGPAALRRPAPARHDLTGPVHAPTLGSTSVGNVMPVGARRIAN